MKTFEDSEFKQIIQSTKPVAIKFFATWCPPCERFAPIAEQAAEALKDTVDFYSANIDDLPETAVEANIVSIPTTAVYKSGAEVARYLGIVKNIEQCIKDAVV